MGADVQESTSWINRAHELLFSLNCSLVAVSILFLIAPRVSSPFNSFEAWLNKLVGAAQTDLIKGYVAFGTASVLLMICLWALLRLSSRSALTETVLGTVSGIIILFSVPGFWFYYYYLHGWPFRWPYRWIPLELAAVFLCAIFFARGRWPFRMWILPIVLALHFTYWYVIPGRGFYPVSNSGGLIAPILGFFSTLVWVFYMAKDPPKQLCNEEYRHRHI
jgi:hypothetical protein